MGSLQSWEWGRGSHRSSRKRSGLRTQIWRGRLHEYIVDGRRYGTPDPTYDNPEEVVRESGVRHASVLPHEGTEILYVYDFGDYWQHDVRLETISPADPTIRYPRVVDGARSCPPEDCGGSGGYAELLEILLDPDHEEFEHMREWAGPRFNAEVFSHDAANGKFGAGGHRRRNRPHR